MVDGEAPLLISEAVARRAPALFGSRGHAGTSWTTVDGILNASGRIKWVGGSATAHAIRSMAGEADIVSRSLELHFSWNLGFVDAESRSGRRAGTYANRPRNAFVLPGGTGVEFVLKEVRDFQLLSIEFDQEFLMRISDLQPSTPPEIPETWEYDDPLNWQLAHLIYDECTSGAPQGAAYTETAATLLAMHLVRTLSTNARPSNYVRRGGLAPTALRRACDYMVSRLGEDVSLSEIAAITGLSPGHFTIAFRQSLRMSPFAWLRRQRIDKAKALLRDSRLDQTSIALAVGYANQSAFGVAFKRETGLSPIQWRQRHLS